MKNKFLIVIGSILVVIIAVYVYRMVFYQKLPEVVNYTIVSDKGTFIPAKLYSRIADDKGKNIQEFIICFNDTLIEDQSYISKYEKLEKYLLIVPKYEMMGLMERRNSCLKEKDGYILQTSDDPNRFTSMINNTLLFEDPVIKEASFKKNQITFNTYGVLKKFGEKVIINIHE